MLQRAVSKSPTGLFQSLTTHPALVARHHLILWAFEPLVFFPFEFDTQSNLMPSTKGWTGGYTGPFRYGRFINSIDHYSTERVGVSANSSGRSHETGHSWRWAYDNLRGTIALTAA